MAKASKEGTKSKKFYADELNRMFNFGEREQIDWTKLELEDLIFFYMFKKTNADAGTKTPPTSSTSSSSVLDGSLAMKILDAADPTVVKKIRDRAKDKFPLVTLACEAVMEKRM